VSRFLSAIGKLPTQDALKAIASTLGTGLIWRRSHPLIATLMTVGKHIVLVRHFNFTLPAIDLGAIGFNRRVHKQLQRFALLSNE